MQKVIVRRSNWEPWQAGVFAGMSYSTNPASNDLRLVRKGKVEDPLIYGDDIIVVEQSGSKTVLRRFIESVPVLGMFNIL